MFIAESVSEKIKIDKYLEKLQAKTSRALSSSFSSVLARRAKTTMFLLATLPNIHRILKIKYVQQK